MINRRLHPHLMPHGEKAFGGHLEPDTTVFMFAVVTLGVLDGGLDLKRSPHGDLNSIFIIQRYSRA